MGLLTAISSSFCRVVNAGEGGEGGGRGRGRGRMGVDR